MEERLVPIYEEPGKKKAIRPARHIARYLGIFKGAAGIVLLPVHARVSSFGGLVEGRAGRVSNAARTWLSGRGCSQAATFTVALSAIAWAREIRGAKNRTGALPHRSPSIAFT